MRRLKVEPKKALSSIKLDRTSEGLRNLLFDQIENLINGKTTALQANSVARMADGILRTVELELEVERQARVLEKQGTSLKELLPPNVPLGNKEDASSMPVPGSPAFREEEENGERGRRALS